MTATGTKAREARVLVDDLPAEHLGELEYLWDRRAAMVRSYDHFADHLATLDRRLEANAVGLEVARRPALPVLEEALGGDEATLAAAAAWGLLRIGGERAEGAVLSALESGAPPVRAGVCEALVRGPAGAVLDRVRPLVASPDAALAVAAAEVLAAHGDAGVARALPAWLPAPEPAVRLGACRVAAWAATGAERLEAAARGDADADVRLAAYEAGLWQRAPWALALGRERARAADAAHVPLLALFAAIAESADAPAIAALGANAALGPGRWGVLAAYGSAPALEACLAGTSGADAADAAAAGAALLRTTGFAAGVAKRVELPPPAGAGPDAAEFAEEAFVPDPAVAKRQWDSRRGEFAKGRRWSRGLEADAAGPSVLAAIDLGARREALLRARFRGAWNGTRRELLLLPR